MANKIVLKSISLATYSNSWQLLATKRVAGCCNFVLGKQDGERDGTYGSFRRLGRLVQTFPLPCKGLSEHVIETIRIARRDYLNDRKVTCFFVSAAKKSLLFTVYSLRFTVYSLKFRV